MGNRIIWRLVSSFVLLVLCSVLILSFFVSINLRDYLNASITDRLQSNAILVGRVLHDEIRSGTHYTLKALIRGLAFETNTRVTLLDTSGNVLGDSESDTMIMENHAHREEVIKALSTGFGQSSRHSATLDINMKYVAIALKEGAAIKYIVRLSLPLSEVEAQVGHIYKMVLTGGGVALVFVMVIGFLVSRGIIGPLTEMTAVAKAITHGDFSRRLSLQGDDELVVLARSLNRMSDELQQKIKHLQEADRLKTELVANVSHELKTPLTSIMGFIETLQDGAIEDADNSRRFLSIIDRHAKRLSVTVNDLLQLSELEGGRYKLNLETLDLNDLINDVATGFLSATGQRRQQMEVQCQGEPVIIRADRVRMEQAISNVIDNAIKYTPDGGKVIVTVRKRPEGVDITVSDTGIGIPPEHLAHVFNRFYRVDKARSRKAGGSGLGLAIVKHTMLLHGGAVSIDSEHGKGTRITLKLPDDPTGTSTGNPHSS